jgi:hypothetical protein
MMPLLGIFLKSLRVRAMENRREKQKATHPTALGGTVRDVA